MDRKRVGPWGAIVAGSVCVHPTLGRVAVTHGPYDYAPVVLYIGSASKTADLWRRMARGENRVSVVDVVRLDPGTGGSVRHVHVDQLTEVPS